MPQKSGFFDTTADDPREYPAREFAEYFSRFVGNGIFGGGEKLKVTASGKDMNVSVSLGYGWIAGYMYAVYDTPLVLPIEQATTQDRIDRIVLRLDVSTPVRAIRAIVLQGLPAATPQAPAIVRSGDIYDLSLAQVLVKANTSTIQPFQITDERLNNQVCGIVTGLIDQADTTSIFNEFQSWLNTKTAEYQKQWQDFMDSIKDEGFAPMKHTHDASDIVSGIIDTARLRGATTGQFGVCKLYDGVDGGAGAGNYLAASTLAVKKVYDEVLVVKQSVVDGKGKVAGAINDMGGGPVSANSTFDQLAAAITGLQQAKGDLAYTNTFFDSLGQYTTYRGIFINKANNFILVKGGWTSPSSGKYQSELCEVTSNGTVIRAVPLGATRDVASNFAVGDGAVLVATRNSSTNVSLFEVYDHMGTLISKSSVGTWDPLNIGAISRDGLNTFIVQVDNPIRIVNHAGTPYFTMPDGSGDASEAIFLSKTKLYVLRRSYAETVRKQTLITRDNLSFNYATASGDTPVSSIMHFLGAHAYR